MDAAGILPAATKPKRHIFILAGQSNMSGRGGVKNSVWDGIVPAICRPHPSILSFSSSSNWELAREPLHADIDSSKTCGIGPAMSFANSIITNSCHDHKNYEVGLVPCAIGGTAIKEWIKGSRLYEEMVKRAKEAAEAEREEDGCEIRCVLWFQGESDTLSDESAESYRENMEKLIGDLRSDLNLPSLPFIQVYFRFIILCLICF